MATHQPLLLVLDDLHWADLSSIGLLAHLGRRLADNPILIVGAYRSEDVALGRDGESHPLTTILSEFKRQLGNIWLDLDQGALDEAREFVDALLDAEPNRLPEDFRQAFAAHTRGQPLFTIELLRDLQERGDLRQDERGRWVAGPHIQLDLLPPRVEGVIETRIERLDPDLREILSAASVMGEEFTAEVVARVLHMEERLLIRRLAGTLNKRHHLVRNAGSERVGRKRLSHFRFQHNLFQKYLYQNLNESERGYLHEDTGLALEHLYAGQTEVVAVQLAHQYQEAGVGEKVVVYLIMAGEQALRLSASEEAAQHFNQALPLLAEMPENEERRRQEFIVQFNLGKVGVAVKGWGAPELSEIYNRALALARQLGDPRKIIEVLLALTQYAQFRSEFEMAQAYGEECRSLAQELQDPELLMLANQALLMISSGLGQHGKLVTYSDEVGAYYRSRLAALTFDDVFNLIFNLGLGSLSLVPAGYPDRALRQAEECLALAQEREHHRGIATALGFLAATYIRRYDWPEGLQFGEALLKFWKGHVSLLQRTYAEIHVGVTTAMLGDVDEGMDLAGQAFAERAKMGMNLADAGFKAYLGEACGQAGRVTEGLELVNKALAEIEVSNDRQNEPEILRIKGNLLLLQDLPADEQAFAQQEAEVSFRRSIEVAEYQQAKLWEARALASLCRLLHNQGRDEGCRQQL
jgi:tetratricopeptide (TPR) repeat protein